MPRNNANNGTNNSSFLCAPGCFFNVIMAMTMLFAACSKKQIDIDKQPAAITKNNFDTIYFPQGTKCGRAYTYWCFMCMPEFTGDTSFQRKQNENWSATFIPRTARVALSLPLTIWVPFGVSDKLMMHEYGHCKICKRIYDTAEQVAFKSAKQVLNAQFTANEASKDDASFYAIKNARDELCGRYTQQTQKVADDISVIYDRITNHGMNDVSEDTAIKQAFDEHNTKQTSEEECNGKSVAR